MFYNVGLPCRHALALFDCHVVGGGQRKHGGGVGLVGLNCGEGVNVRDKVVLGWVVARVGMSATINKITSMLLI